MDRPLLTPGPLIRITTGLHLSSTISKWSRPWWCFRKIICTMSPHQAMAMRRFSLNTKDHLEVNLLQWHLQTPWWTENTWCLMPSHSNSLLHNPRINKKSSWVQVTPLTGEESLAQKWKVMGLARVTLYPQELTRQLWELLNRKTAQTP